MSASRWSSLLFVAFALSPAAHAQTTFNTYRLTRIDHETFELAFLFVNDINEKGEMVVDRLRPDSAPRPMSCAPHTTRSAIMLCHDGCVASQLEVLREPYFGPDDVAEQFVVEETQ